jgi:hypothetical protein
LSSKITIATGRASIICEPECLKVRVLLVVLNHIARPCPKESPADLSSGDRLAT